MNFKEFLKEEYINSIKSTYGNIAEIFKNPGKSEYSEILKLATIDNEVRGWLNPKNKNVYMWASWLADHNDVANKAKLPISKWIPFHILPNNTVQVATTSLPDNYNWYKKEEHLFLIDALKSNPTLNKILSNFKVK